MNSISSGTQLRIFALCASLAMVLGSGVAYAAPGNEWASPGGDDALTRHSTLTDINKNNAGKLPLAWSMPTGATLAHV